MAGYLGSLKRNGQLPTTSPFPRDRFLIDDELDERHDIPQPRFTRMASSNSRNVPVTIVRNKSIDDMNDQVVNMLDDVEKRVEQLREAAATLEQEKEQILEVLNDVVINTGLLRLGQGDRDDITAITNRLASRTKTVEVVVNTPRTAEQQQALTSVNTMIDTVMKKIEDDIKNGKETARRYLNACSPDQPEGPIDQRFQSKVIECTADDQKKVRRKLTQLINQLERTERTCIVHHF
ncbi:unnamed protein product [Auanema sp. JU1783]|nr:unnamed protein product [Auanema sp. JU1783]